MRTLLVIVALACSGAAFAQFDDEVGEMLGVGVAGGAPVKGAAFDLNVDATGSGPSLLPALAVNGTTMTPVVDCRGEQVSGANLACTTGGTFAEGNSGGASPTSALAVPFVDGAARGVTFTTGGKSYVAANGTVGNVTTEDLVFEFIAVNPGAGYSIAGSYNGAAGGGWELIWSSGNSVALTLQTPSGGNSLQSSAATLAAGAWYHVMVFADRSANDRFYVNGVLSGTPAAALSTSIASSNTMVIGGRPGAPGQTGPTVLSRFTMSSCNGCLNTTSEMDAIAAQRFAQVAGVYPAISKGGQTPTLATRASSANVDVDRDGDGIRRIFTVGANWTRVARRKATVGTHAGLLAEDASTNLALQSQTFDSVSWTKLNVTATADTTVAPDLTTTADSMAQTASAGVVAHCFTQAPTLTATTYDASVFLKASTRTFAYLNDATIANGAAWINLSTCAAGTKQVGVGVLTAESWGSGWCRVGISFTGTAAAHTIQVCAASADNVTTYDGGVGTATQIVAWGAQVEANSTTQPSSYIATTSATVTRAGDGFRWSMPAALASATTITVVSDVLFPGAMGSSDRCPWVIADNPALPVNYIELDDFSSLLAVLGPGGLNAQGGAVYDNTYHRVRATIASSNTRLFVDGVQTASDLTHAKPTIASGSVCVGTGLSGGGANLNALVGRLTIYPFNTTVLP